MAEEEAKEFYPPSQRPRWRSYGLALLAVGLAMAARMGITPLAGPSALPFIFFFPAIAVTGWYGGLGPSITAIILSVAAARWFFTEPLHSFRIQTAYEITAILAFLIASGLIAAAFELMHRARALAVLRAAERAEVDSLLAQEKELLATTLSSIGDAVIATNEKGEVRYLNPEAERLTGWKSEEAQGQPLPRVFKIINEASRKPVENPVEKVLQSGTVVGLANHTLLVAKDGTEIPIDDSAAPIRHGKGPLQGVVLVFRNVTEQRKAQEALARLAAIVQFSSDVIFTKNLDGTVQTWNASAQRLFGYTAEEIIGKPVTMLFPPDRLQEEDVILSKLRAGQPVERLETIRVAKDGRQIPVSISISPLKNAEGEIVGASKVLHDITEIVTAREALQQEKELLATTLASIGDAVIVTDSSGRVNFLNQEAERLTGWSRADAQGQPLPKVFHIVNEQTRQRVENPVEKVLRLGIVVGLANHTMVISRDGCETPIDDSAAPIRRPGGPLFGVVLVFRDITEQKKAAEALKESERTHRLLANITELAARFPDSRNFIQAISERVATEFNVSRCGYAHIDTDANEVRVEEDYHSDLPSLAGTYLISKYAQHFLEEAMNGRVTVVEDLRADSRTAHLYESVFEPLQVRSHVDVPLHDKGKWVGSFWMTHHAPRHWSAAEIACLRTIAERIWVLLQRNAAQAALQEAHAQLADKAVQLEKIVDERTAKLREMVNELQHVSYAIVHDMRAPLRAMHSFAQTILEDISKAPQPTEDIVEYCRRIIVASARLDKLIQDALNYTKAVLREVPLQPVDLMPLVQGLIETYPNLHAENADIKIENRLPVVLGEESLLTQCFSNLLGNAVKFVRPGTRPRILVQCETNGEMARITIEDNGIGIAPKAQSRLFGMFERLTADYEGTGIGLAIVRKVVERMGGRVGAQSELGKGSRFWVELRTADRVKE